MVEYGGKSAGKCGFLDMGPREGTAVRETPRGGGGGGGGGCT